MIESLPCASCTALCCGPVSITAARMDKIREYVQTIPVKERKRLARQVRSPLDCGFLDTETHCCAIYPVRPWVCEAFGRVKGMQCPKVPGLVQIIPAFIEETRAAAELETDMVAISTDFDWRSIK